MTAPTTEGRARRAAVPEPAIVEGEFVPSRGVPFSKALDALIAEIRAGRAPNIGRFCGYCSAPLRAALERCPTCGTSAQERPPGDRIAREVAAIYRAKRRQEARIIHSAAWLGILIGVAIGIALLLLLPSWTKVFGVLFLIGGSYYIASYLGNVLAQDYAYTRGLRQFARQWQEFAAQREGSIATRRSAGDIARPPE